MGPGRPWEAPGRALEALGGPWPAQSRLIGDLGPILGPWRPIWAHMGPLGPYGPWEAL